MKEFVATKVWFEGDKIYIQTDDDRVLWQSMLYYRSLADATNEQRENYDIGQFGIHWDDIDEDVSFESFEYDNPEPTTLSKFFLDYPELKVSQIAARIGISQSLLASYVCGVKNPSKARLAEIESAIHCLGQELIKVKFE